MPWRFPPIDWNRPRTRKVVAVLAYLGTVAVQAGLANIPVVVDAAKFSPLVVPAGDELVIQGPVVNSPGGTLFSRTGDTEEILDLRFPRARLAPSTVEQWKALGAPGELRNIRYVTQESSASVTSKQRCHSSIEIKLVDSSSSPAEIGLFQLEGQSNTPYAEMEVKNASLAVSFDTDSDSPDHTLSACGYQKLLQLSSLQQDGSQSDRPWHMDITQSLPPITVIVDSDSAFRFYFQPLEKGAPSKASDGRMLPLDLGTPKVRFEDAPPFRAIALWKKSQSKENARSHSVDFSARALNGQALLDISKLEIGSDRIQLSFSGKAHVEVQGKEQTSNLWDKVKEVPLLQRSLEAANAALLGWVGLVLFRKTKSNL